MDFIRLSAKDKSLMDDFKNIILLLDQKREISGSFVCEGRLESEIISLTLNSLKNNIVKNFSKHMIEVFKDNPNDDWIFRSNCTSRIEPKPLDSVFLPRDPQRNGIFLPYIIYAMGKLYQNFLRQDVQEEFIKHGHEPESVELIPFVQKVAGVRDQNGDLGRERTVSFSSYIDRKIRKFQSNLVLGLPILATRPNYQGNFQSIVVKLENLALPLLFDDPKLQITIDWQKHSSKKYEFLEKNYRQTYKTVFIPEKGIVYEKINLNVIDHIFRVKISHGNKIGFLPITWSCLEDLHRLLIELTDSFLKDNEEIQKWRIDGLLMQKPNSDLWEKPVVVGLKPLP